MHVSSTPHTPSISRLSAQPAFGAVLGAGTFERQTRDYTMMKRGQVEPLPIGLFKRPVELTGDTLPVMAVKNALREGIQQFMAETTLIPGHLYHQLPEKDKLRKALDDRGCFLPEPVLDRAITIARDLLVDEGYLVKAAMAHSESREHGTLVDGRRSVIFLLQDPSQPHIGFKQPDTAVPQAVRFLAQKFSAAPGFYREFTTISPRELEDASGIPRNAFATALLVLANRGALAVSPKSFGSQQRLQFKLIDAQALDTPARLAHQGVAG